MLSRKRNAIVALFGVLVAAAGGLWFLQRFNESTLQADPDNPAQVALGRAVYASHCASCHGANLEGEPNWQTRKPSGRLPAPPHDASGHTWHHPDAQLFGIVKNGITPYAPAGYQSDMPVFAATLSDQDILAVLAYIKNAWPPDIREQQADISRRAE